MRTIKAKKYVKTNWTHNDKQINGYLTFDETVETDLIYCEGDYSRNYFNIKQDIDWQDTELWETREITTKEFLEMWKESDDLANHYYAHLPLVKEVLEFAT